MNSPAGWCPGCGGKIRQLLLKVLSRALSCPGQLFPPCFQVQKGLGGWYAFKPCLGIVLVSFFFLPGHHHIITLLFGSRCQNRPQLLPLGSCCACSLVFSQLALLFTPKTLSFTDRPPEASIPGSMSDPAVPVELSSDSKTRAARQYAEDGVLLEPRVDKEWPQGGRGDGWPMVYQLHQAEELAIDPLDVPVHSGGTSRPFLLRATWLSSTKASFV